MDSVPSRWAVLEILCACNCLVLVCKAISKPSKASLLNWLFFLEAFLPPKASQEGTLDDVGISKLHETGCCESLLRKIKFGSIWQESSWKRGSKPQPCWIGPSTFNSAISAPQDMAWKAPVGRWTSWCMKHYETIYGISLKFLVGCLRRHPHRHTHTHGIYIYIYIIIYTCTY